MNSSSFSIRTKILLSYFTIILVVGSLTLSVGVTAIFIQTRYESINKNIVLEQRMHDLASELPIESYNAFKTGNYDKYYKRLSEIRAIEKQLDAQMPDDRELVVAYKAVKNSLNNVVEEIEMSKDIETISQSFQKTSLEFEYVRANTEQLILSETNRLSEITQQTERVKPYLLLGGGIIMFLGLGGTLMFAFVFANKLTRPIIKLSELARTIANGNLTVEIDKRLVEMRDETGRLSMAFDMMVKRLREQIESLKKTQDDLLKSKAETEERRDELERMNGLMVGRELKMAELKKEIETLKTQQA